ncbi:Anabaena sensory rhodopsin transducer [Nonomuraea coxensis DSM 45129]|uniref:Sensory rhodopsin transducer n=1 Tax=Nonomuraea coxensis DSM 45129 TaxID=1122611 RepID=A0ABX8U354_9ACTN|nr:sensory rhodopsin transducer [Nonomuraea coxensis]QYC42172.1 Anabaena sensory rhodopsin transducer [Nonomuraea coxensis DSM 45129]
MRTLVGAERMAVTEGWAPGDRLHLFNVGPRTAGVELTFCAEGRPPLGPYRTVVPAQRHRALSLEELAGPAVLSPAIAYAVVIVADVDVLVDLTRDTHEASRRPAA